MYTSPPFRSSPRDGSTDSFSLSILFSSRNLFILGDFNAITPSGTQEVLPIPVGRKYSTESSPLTSSPSMTLTHLPFSIAPPLTSPVLPFLLLFPGPGRCFRTWVLTIYQFFYSSLSLRLIAPMSILLRSIFRKLARIYFVSYIDSHCPSAGEYSFYSLFSAAALFTSLALNAAKSSIPFGRIKRHPKAWWSAEVESAVSERRKLFAASHRSDEDRQVYISASQRTSSVIAKAKAEAWQTTCSSLSLKSNPKSEHSLLRYIAGSPSSSPNFPNCSSPRESPSVFADYLVCAFLSFHLEDIFYYSHPQDGKASRLSCFIPAYLSHLLCLKAF